MSARRGRSPPTILRDRTGAAAVEFALVSPLLILLFIGVIELGWALHCAASVRWALETSARALLINPTLTAGQLQSAMIDKLSGVADPGNLSVSITPNAATKTLIVRSHYAAQLAIPFVSADSLIFENAVTVPDLE